MTIAEGKSRVTITLGNELLGKLDDYLRTTGMSRSSYISYVVATQLYQQERLTDGVTDKINALLKELMESDSAGASLN